jgi:hypothetical protein
MNLTEDGYLRFEHKTPFRDSFFLVDHNKITDSALHEDLKQSLMTRRAYSTYEIDDLVLGPLEDLGSLEGHEQKVISFALIYDFFSWYIVTAWKNEEIQRYVHCARTERAGAADLYEHLQSLAERCEKHEHSAR